MISMLQSGKNGEQILSILDTITAQDESSEYNEPTLDSIEFWYELSSVLVTLWQLAQCPSRWQDAVPIMISVQFPPSQMNLTFKQIDCLVSLIEFHDDWDEVSELMGTDVSELYDILTELRDAAN